MYSKIGKLLSIASLPLCIEQPDNLFSVCKPDVSGCIDLQYLLMRCNGFYAFESALHVFPVGSTVSGYTLSEWNDTHLWKRSYEWCGLDNVLFFSENIFGEQFGLTKECIVKFDPETGDSIKFSNTIEEWAERLLEDYAVETGFPIAHKWQQQFGPLKPGVHLVPKKLFVLGGEFAIDNVYAVDAVKGMLFRADIAGQIRNLPDGSKARIIVREPES